jgi:hypothetical protein
MEPWQSAYLGQRSFPKAFTSRELSAFFTFSSRERTFIDSHRHPTYRVAIALHLGFLRMTGCSPGPSATIPESLWNHLADQLKADRVSRPAVFRDLYATRDRARFEHRAAVHQFAGWVTLTGHRTDEALQWLKRLLAEQPDHLALLQALRVWLYGHRILIAPGRTLRQLVTRAGREVEAAWRGSLTSAFGEAALTRWISMAAQAPAADPALQQWRVIASDAPAYPPGKLLDIIGALYACGIQQGWPAACPPAMVGYYARRHAQRPPAASQRTDVATRMLETACFMRYVLCRATDQLLTQLRSWIARTFGEVAREVAARAPDFLMPAREFAHTVRALTADASRFSAEVCSQLHALAEAQLEHLASTRASRVRVRLLSRGQQADALLARLVHLKFEAPPAHPVMDALNALRDVYARQLHTLPSDVPFRLTRTWRPLVNSADRRQALHAFEWATLLALRRALRDGSLRIEHSSGP